MLGWMLVATLVLGARPPELVKPGEEAAYTAWLSAKIREAAGAYAGKDCSAASLTSLIHGKLGNDPMLAGHPEIYLYEEAFAVQGCGQADVQQLLVHPEATGWRAITLMPGRTTAGPTLQHDILMNVTMAGAVIAKRADPTCAGDALAKSFRVVDTRSQVATAGPRIERWTVHACNSEYALDVGLDPDAGGGTQIKISVPGVKP